MKLTRNESIRRRHLRLRNKIAGTPERPRLYVRRTLKHLHVQVFDDSLDRGSRTLFSISTYQLEGAEKGGHYANVKSAAEFGKKAAAEISSKGISAVVFDRGGYKYHGVVKALADGLREGGLQF
ncbi:MAG: 50S ribosomal protein L18 [Candidatus Sumerlaeia bacterium]|nr:50S ribosomal protein L18 [Candidatus Sumerlaeia bacterium]